MYVSALISTLISNFSRSKIFKQILNSKKIILKNIFLGKQFPFENFPFMGCLYEIYIDFLPNKEIFFFCIFSTKYLWDYKKAIALLFDFDILVKKIPINALNSSLQENLCIIIKTSNLIHGGEP